MKCLSLACDSCEIVFTFPKCFVVNVDEIVTCKQCPGDTVWNQITMSSSGAPVLAVRGSTGIQIYQGPPSYDPVTSFPIRKRCKAMVFSPNGQYFAWFDGLNIVIVEVSTWKIIKEIEKPNTVYISFSPKGTYLNSWEHFIVSPENPSGTPNLSIWKAEDGSLIRAFTQKKQINWEPEYSKDENVCARSDSGQVLFYEGGNFAKPAHKINRPKVDGFSLSPTTGSVYHVLCYMPGSTGPSIAKLFQYPNFDGCIASKSFFKADRVAPYWNSKGNQVLLLTSTETDESGASYYGKQSLHFLSTKGDTAIVLLNKEGPIHCVCWSPNGDEFCVVYGFMPSKAALFNNKCEVVYDFGSGPRNSIYFNPHGNLLLLGGFGNINGHVEIWDAVQKRLVKKMTAQFTTLLQWSPDGMHFVAATTAPRLRVDNGFKIYHYSGALMYERPWNKMEELWEVLWQTYPENKFKKPTISHKQVEGIQPAEPTASKEVYRPPAARGKPSAVKMSIHEDAENAESKQLSKAVLKMKKKRETKRQAKLQQQQQSDDTPVTNAPVKNGTSAIGDAVSSGNPSGMVDKAAKIKKIKLNLKGIEKLKELKATGKELDNNQLKKIERESELLRELESLQL